MSSHVFWFPIAIGVAALLVAALVVLVASLRKRRVIPASLDERQEMASLPMTPLQKRAWWSLSIGLAMVVAIVVVIAGEGPLAYFDDGDSRLLVLAFIFVVLGSHLAVVVPAGLEARSGSALDERDKRVLATGPLLQSAACLVTVAAWMVALTEGYRGEGIPTGFMYLVFWSVFIAQILAHSGGILLGYWLARHHA